jgi:hypothetical protein
MRPDERPIRDDPRARKILFDTYWTTAGWLPVPIAADADREYAIAAGYMFPHRVGSHDEWVAAAQRVRDRTALEDVAAAFVGSLSRRRLAQRSALGSYSAVRHLDRHRWREWSAHCADCGVPRQSDEDLNVLSFERHRWGGVRHGSPIYASFDLEVFARSERPTETAEDIAILNALLTAARQSRTDDRPRDLERAIASVVPSNKEEREILLGILALCGVLASPDHPGLFDRWVPYTDRQPPPRPSKNDWHYPMFWWRGSAGVNEDAARAVFGDRIR